MKNKRYGKFILGDIFITNKIKNKLQVPTGGIVQKNDLVEGKTPRITVSAFNNGITGYYKDIENNNYRVYENCISCSFLGTIFYHPYRASFDMKVHCLKLKNKDLNVKIAMYLIPLIKKAIGETNYGEQLSSTDIPLKEIQLPIKDSIEKKEKYGIEDIDYEYMEERIKELEEERIKELEKYLEVSGLENYELTKEDEEVLKRKVEFKEFKLSDIFEASNGDIDLQQKDVNDKGEYIITSGDSNCGILGKTDREAKIFDKNTITVDMFGSSYFRDFKYKMVTHARVFSLKRKDKVGIKLNEGLYYISQLKTLKQKHSYNNMCSWKKAQDMIITLPITKEGNIDYEYMDNYIQAIKKKTIAGVVKYKDQVIEITKKVVANTNKR